MSAVRTLHVGIVVYFHVVLLCFGVNGTTISATLALHLANFHVYVTMCPLHIVSLVGSHKQRDALFSSHVVATVLQDCEQ